MCVISRILELLRSVKYNSHHVHLSAEFRKDIQWWRRFLRKYNGVSLINTSAWSSPGEVFTTDAGGISAHGYFHSEFPDFILSQHLDINCLELLTVMVALKLWGRHWSGLRLTVRCDNEVAVTVLNSGRCRNSFVNACLREICFLSATFGFEIRAVHLPGSLNEDADLLSRWDTSPEIRSRFLCKADRDNLSDIALPSSHFLFDNSY